MTNAAIKSDIVTGASGGVRPAVATRLASDGFAVTVNYAGNLARAQEVVAEIKAAGGKGIPAQADVAKAADFDHRFAETLEVFGSLDVVVHCAGIVPLFPISEEGVDRFDKVIAINLRGTRLVLAQAAKHIAVGRRIIVFSKKVHRSMLAGHK
jgi:3-oxoacyl-[acyl-carrier protein] reductase